MPIQEPLNLPGQQTRSKNFKTPLFSRYQKFLSWGNLNGSKTSPNFFFEKISQQIWLLEALEVLAYLDLPKSYDQLYENLVHQMAYFQ